MIIDHHGGNGWKGTFGLGATWHSFDRADMVQGKKVVEWGVGRGVQMMKGWIYIRCKYCLSSGAGLLLDQNQERGSLQ